MTVKKRFFWKIFLVILGAYDSEIDDLNFIKDLAPRNRNSLLLTLEKKRTGIKKSFWLAIISIVFILVLILLSGDKRDIQFGHLALVGVLYLSVHVSFIHVDSKIKLIKVVEMLEKKLPNNTNEDI